MERDDATLIDIVKAAQAITLFIQDTDQEKFLIDYKTQSAVLYQLLIIGEAVKRLSENFRERHKEIPWVLIAGMRNHLIHGYDIVDWDEVWKTAKVDIPALQQNIENIIQK